MTALALGWRAGLVSEGVRRSWTWSDLAARCSLEVYVLLSSNHLYVVKCRVDLTLTDDRSPSFSQHS